MVLAKERRWFIWALVIVVVAGVGLAAYISVVNTSDTADAASGLIVHRPKPALPNAQNAIQGKRILK